MAAGTRARALAAVVGVVAALTVALTGCSGATPPAPGAPGAGPAAPPPGRAPAARVTTVPAAGTGDVVPAEPATVSVADGTLRQVALTDDTGRPVAGAPSPDARSWSSTEHLGYGRTYSWSGTASGPTGAAVPVGGSFRTVVPARLVHGTFSAPDGGTVGVAAPVILTFDGPVADRAAVQRALTLRTSVPVPGSWAWLPDTAEGARIHFRPRSFWPSGTTIDVAADLAGVPFGNGAWGAARVTTHLTIGRTQIVQADNANRRVVVYRDGVPVQDVPASFGIEDDPVLNTRNGVHVVLNKTPEAFLSNPAYHYANIQVLWAVRISNNGEFMHFNPSTPQSQGQANLTHGCINMNGDNAKAYYDTAMYGDPVDVVNSPVPLSSADGDIYDWALDYDTWRSMSALPVPPDPPLAGPADDALRFTPPVFRLPPPDASPLLRASG